VAVNVGALKRTVVVSLVIAYGEVISRSAVFECVVVDGAQPSLDSPSLSTRASAGWVGMSKWVYTAPSSSLICGKVSVCRSTKS
jgi:hypothetical protein